MLRSPYSRRACTRWRIKTAIDLDAHQFEVGADTLTVDDWCIRGIINETDLSADAPKWIKRSHDSLFVLGPWYRLIEPFVLVAKRILGVHHGPLRPRQQPDIEVWDSSGFILERGFQPFPFHWDRRS
jgi:hypothetical protein